MNVLRHVRRFPLLLAAVVAVLAIAVVGQLVATSARRRRDDMAVLGALGFVRRQRSAVVLWHTATLAVAASIVGIPLGVFAGRWAWGLVRRDVGLPAGSLVPWPVVALVVPVAVVAAIAVAAVPAWRAGRVDAASTLRSKLE